MREEEGKNDRNIAELKCPDLDAGGIWEKTVPQEEAETSLEFAAEKLEIRQELKKKDLVWRKAKWKSLVLEWIELEMMTKHLMGMPSR